MTLFELFEKIKEMKYEIERKEARVDYLEKQSMLINGPMYGVDKVDRTPSRKAPFEIPILKKLDLEKDIEQDVEEFNAQRNLASIELEKVENVEIRNVLFYRYICFNSVSDIQSIVHYSRSAIYRYLEEGKEIAKSIKIEEKPLNKTWDALGHDGT